ncbi:uncharacterized protein ASCRUDRAFT_70311 [Ascoidea rubescens DSM 1968]|uniref:Uncharacterized protein n=1 Tax=Ascoidea rubescens DSM 1968 TaxID=1344418 RepID=A0A1D2VHF7_9ASCO|nr:hypothetical protein ASCRUDRAFT_70311 [Ascoidea rubescens DSM 1968]ODV61088.1 hypothetical protein ASCRUDRAFT_70311 [Ascoidea rubescens DSM 1968]
MDENDLKNIENINRVNNIIDKELGVFTFNPESSSKIKNQILGDLNELNKFQELIDKRDESIRNLNVYIHRIAERVQNQNVSSEQEILTSLLSHLTSHFSNNNNNNNNGNGNDANGVNGVNRKIMVEKKVDEIDNYEESIRYINEKLINNREFIKFIRKLYEKQEFLEKKYYNEMNKLISKKIVKFKDLNYLNEEIKLRFIEDINSNIYNKLVRETYEIEREEDTVVLFKETIVL